MVNDRFVVICKTRQWRHARGRFSFRAHLADAHAGHASHLEIRLKNTRCDLRSTVIMTTRESFKFMFDPGLSRQSDRFHFTGKAAEASNETFRTCVGMLMSLAVAMRAPASTGESPSFCTKCTAKTKTVSFGSVLCMLVPSLSWQNYHS